MIMEKYNITYELDGYEQRGTKKNTSFHDDIRIQPGISEASSADETIWLLHPDAGSGSFSGGKGSRALGPDELFPSASSSSMSSCDAVGGYTIDDDSITIATTTTAGTALASFPPCGAENDPENIQRIIESLQTTRNASDVGFPAKAHGSFKQNNSILTNGSRKKNKKPATVTIQIPETRGGRENKRGDNETKNRGGSATGPAATASLTSTNTASSSTLVPSASLDDPIKEQSILAAASFLSSSTAEDNPDNDFNGHLVLSSLFSYLLCNTDDYACHVRPNVEEEGGTVERKKNDQNKNRETTAPTAEGIETSVDISQSTPYLYIKTSSRQCADLFEESGNALEQIFFDDDSIFEESRKGKDNKKAEKKQTRNRKGRRRKK